MTSTLRQAGGAAVAGGANDAAQAPLTDQEVELVKRLFSDPFTIPLEFKAWLVAYLEANPPYLVTGSIAGFKAALDAAVAGTPVTAFPGVIWDYIGPSDPSEHWMICDHRELPIVDYQKLYDTIGTRYNGLTVPAAGNFCIPDLRGRMTVGLGPHADVATLGLTEGAALASRRPKHQHLVNAIKRWSGSGSSTDGVPGYNPASTDLGSTQAGITVGPQTGLEPVDGPAYTVVNKIIYVG